VKNRDLSNAVRNVLRLLHLHFHRV
jgi:hypothetical protein